MRDSASVDPGLKLGVSPGRGVVMADMPGASDPVGSEFDMYAVVPPDGEWAYALDDFGIKYRRGGGWPFRRGDGDGGAAGVRLAPDTAYQSWRNEYVLLWPGRHGRYDREGTSGWGHASLSLFVRGQGRGGVVVPVVVEIDVVSGAVHVAGDCPGVVLGQAEVKGERLLAFLATHWERAGRARLPRLVTAHEQWARRQRG